MELKKKIILLHKETDKRLLLTQTPSVYICVFFVFNFVFMQLETRMQPPPAPLRRPRRSHHTHYDPRGKTNAEFEYLL